MSYSNVLYTRSMEEMIIGFVLSVVNFWIGVGVGYWYVRRKTSDKKS